MDTIVNERKAIDTARKQLEVERNNNAAVAAGVETVLNAKAKEIDAWEEAFTSATRAAIRADEMREIVERHTIKIRKFESPGKWREDLGAHHERHGIKTASAEEERKRDLMSPRASLHEGLAELAERDRKRLSAMTPEERHAECEGEPEVIGRPEGFTIYDDGTALHIVRPER